MSFARTIAIFTAVGSLAGASHAQAQRLLSVDGQRASIHLEVTKPIVSRDGLFAGSRFATSVWDASLVLPLDRGPTLFARMGLAYASIEGLDDGLTLANPRVGAMVGGEGGRRRAEVHVDLPLATELGVDYATGIGIFSEYEEFERFAKDSWSVGASASAEAEPGPGAFVGARVGGTVLVPTSGDTDIFGLFSFYGDAPTDESRFRLEFSGSVLASRTGVDFSARTAFFASLEVAWPMTRFAPAVFVRAPIDDTLDGTVALVVGARLRVRG